MTKTNFKVALVTGASNGSGKAMAQYLASQGYYVYAAARNKEKLERMEGDFLKALPMDITLMNSVHQGIERIKEEMGSIDVLINNAGYGIYGTVEGLSQNEVQRGFDVNLFGTANVIKKVIPMMRAQKKGTIINVSSTVGKVSLPVLGWYGASKHALEGLTDALRLELRPWKINVVLILPGNMNTGFRKEAMEALDRSDDPPAYKALIKDFKAVIDVSYRNAPSGEVILGALKKILRAKQPKPRYTAGSDAALYLAFKKILSDASVDSMIVNTYKRSSRKVT